MRNARLAERVIEQDVDLVNAEDVFYEMMKMRDLKKLTTIFNKEQITLLLEKMREVYEVHEEYEKCAIVLNWKEQVKNRL